MLRLTLDTPRLAGGAMHAILLAYIAERTSKSDPIVVDTLNLCARLGVSRNTLAKALAHLNALDYIRCAWDSSKFPPSRTVSITAAGLSVCGIVEEVASPHRMESAPASPPTGEERTFLKSGVPKARLAEEFAELWKLYPRKQGKSVALKAYIKARGEGVACEAVRDGLEAFAHAVKTQEPQFVPYGSTWFNQRRWEDTITTNNAIYAQYDHDKSTIEIEHF